MFDCSSRGSRRLKRILVYHLLQLDNLTLDTSAILYIHACMAYMTYTFICKEMPTLDHFAVRSP